MRSLCSVALAAIAFLLSWALPTQARAAPGKLVVAYFANWGDGPEHQVANIPGDLLTHVIYSFGKIENGELSLADNPQFDELRKLKQKFPHLKTLISMGGWGGSAPFSDIALTDESRTKFARSCAAFVKRFGFDGIDIDWEYPTGGGGAEPKSGRPEDTQHCVQLLRALRDALDAQGQADGAKYLLTIAAPAGPQNFPKISAGEVHPLVDWINVMTYDYTGAWSQITSFNAPLFPASADPRANLSVDTTMQMYLGAGVPPGKLVMGVPFYGHAFAGVRADANGLFQPHAKQAPRPADGGEWSYRAIARDLLGKSRRFWNEPARSPWLFDAKSQIMVSYDDSESIRIKAEYAREHRFAGVMIWELSQDDEKHSLLRSINDALAQPTDRK